MSNNETYKIRPAGRHILTIGRDLIQDSYTAIIELVKNAYDADATHVSIEFVGKGTNDFSIIIKDDGHGMTRDTVLNAWMVPSTDNKLKQRTSLKKDRVMQGRKGIGRYASSLLGLDLLLETVDLKGNKTSLYIQWDSFEQAKYLADVEILIETVKVDEPAGTTLSINSTQNDFIEIDKSFFEKLQHELRKLITPDATVKLKKKDLFDVELIAKNFGFDIDLSEQIESYPLLKLFDYSISGRIKSDGTGKLTYINQKEKKIVEEIDFNLNEHTRCGNLDFDIRVYDREGEAIQLLINRGGLKYEDGRPLKKLEVRRLLNISNGIGVYRNGFRIRPLGDAGFDWLDLDKQRVQQPALKISCNQVIGFIQIESEDSSCIEEKAARDGIKDNFAYSRLKKIAAKVISALEMRRAVYRKNAGLSRPSSKIEKDLEKLVSFNNVKENISKKLVDVGVSEEVLHDIENVLNKEEEEKNKVFEEIRKAVAIYQGQATLGKIINIVLHEGRRPLNYFKNYIPAIVKWNKYFKKTNDISVLDKEIIPVVEGVAHNADVFSALFRKIDPLAEGRRSKRVELNIVDEINKAIDVFADKIEEDKVEVSIKTEEMASLLGWKQDIYAIFVNLIDNSLYWFEETKVKKRKIFIDIETENNQLVLVEYRDNGPGILSSLIQSEIIFEPDFSTKTEGGTGLGLAIAGEAARRNNYSLKVCELDTGACFRLERLEDENDE